MNEHEWFAATDHLVFERHVVDGGAAPGAERLQQRAQDVFANALPEAIALEGVVPEMDAEIHARPSAFPRGFEVDLLVRSDLKRFVEAWRGFRDLRDEIRAGRIVVVGPRALVRQFPDWLLLSQLAPYERKLPGKERGTWCRVNKVERASKLNERSAPLPSPH